VLKLWKHSEGGGTYPLLSWSWEAVTMDHVEEGHHLQTTTFQVFQVVKLQAGGGLLQIWCCIFSDCTSFPNHFSINPHYFLWYWHSKFLSRFSEIRQSWWWNMVSILLLKPPWCSKVTGSPRRGFQRPKCRRSSFPWTSLRRLGGEAIRGLDVNQPMRDDNHKNWVYGHL